MPIRYFSVDYNNAYSRTNSRVMLHFLKRAHVFEKSAKLNRLYGRIQTAWQNVFVCPYILQASNIITKRWSLFGCLQWGIGHYNYFPGVWAGQFFFLSQISVIFFFFFFLLLCYIDVSAFVSLKKFFLCFYCEGITFGLLVIHHPPPLPKII